MGLRRIASNSIGGWNNMPLPIPAINTGTVILQKRLAIATNVATAVLRTFMTTETITNRVTRFFYERPLHDTFTTQFSISLFPSKTVNHVIKTLLDFLVLKLLLG